jgi:stage V sporulation protein SpoVS
VSALWQAVCIARKYLQDDRIDVGFSPAFVDITETDESGLGAV